MHINGKTTLFGILGNPVEHSLSPIMHNAAFTHLGLNNVYVPMAPKDLGAALSGLKSIGFRGVSVTVPFKEEVIPYLDSIDATARAIGAVNTLTFTKLSDGSIAVQGTNTDWIGSNAALAQVTELHGASALVLGAGGAAKAVAFGLQKVGATVVIANRTKAKAVALGKELHCAALGLDEIDDVGAEILINTTTVGMAPNINHCPVAPHLLSQYKVVMDIVYAPLETKLLHEAKACGCAVIDGLDMLLFQGAEQFRIWTGHTAPMEVMRKALVTALG
ncbi:MAG: shikimate dehydrogenase [Desulfobacterales bacterium]|nr:MAG: shikimate dehydrogenase [Desulfobacterales bacterium]